MLRCHFPLFGHICPLLNMVALKMETNSCHLVLFLTPVFLPPGAKLMKQQVGQTLLKYHWEFLVT